MTEPVCLSPQEASAAGLTTKYIKEGFHNIKVLGGGVEGWKNAGYPMEE